MRLATRFVVGSVLVAFLSTAGTAQDFKIEPAWSHIEFSVTNFGINHVEGRFKKFTGRVSFNEADVTRSSVSVTIPVSSIDTASKKRDAHLLTADFFETSKYPDMTFESQRIEKVGSGYVLIGLLTIKGHTNEVRLPFTFSLEKSAEGVPTLRAEARGVINRHDFGIDYGSNFSVGKGVEMILHIQALP